MNDSLSERGSALILSLLLLFFLTLIAVAGLEQSVAQIQRSSSQRSKIVADYIAESGVRQVVAAFHRPEGFIFEAPVRRATSCTAAQPDRFFLKRCRAVDSIPGFTDPAGASQFQGTPEEPDLRLSPGGNPLRWNFPGGNLIEVKVYGPLSLGAIAVVEAISEVGDGTRGRYRVELAEAPIPVLKEALRTSGSVRLLPLIHWGKAVIGGDLDLAGDLDRLPIRSPSAAVNGSGYEDTAREDRWFEAEVAGRILQPAPGPDGFPPPHDNLHAHSDLPSGTSPADPDRWDYETLKMLAVKQGRYYRSTGDGRLLAQGTALSVTPDEVFSRSADGWWFVDTTDGKPPAGDNLDTLVLHPSGWRGTFFIVAHVELHPGPGSDARVSPPDGGAEAAVTVSGVQLAGAMRVMGRLTVAGPTRWVGGLYLDGSLSGGDLLEIWYDPTLSSGYRPGFPVVTPLPGSIRRE